MNIKRIVTGVASLVLAAGLAGGLASSAQASAVPVIYNYAGVSWQYPQVRPARVVISGDGAVFGHTWYWNAWNATYAKSTGTLWVNNCRPYCAVGKFSYHKLYVTLSGVKYHNGRAYYSAMKWYTPGFSTNWSGHWSRTITFNFRKYPGGTGVGWVIHR